MEGRYVDVFNGMGFFGAVRGGVEFLCEAGGGVLVETNIFDAVTNLTAVENGVQAHGHEAGTHARELNGGA